MVFESCANQTLNFQNYKALIYSISILLGNQKIDIYLVLQNLNFSPIKKFCHKKKAGLMKSISKLF